LCTLSCVGQSIITRSNAFTREITGNPAHLLKAIDRDTVNVAVSDRHTIKVTQRRRGKGIDPFRHHLVKLGWTPVTSGCNEYLLDTQGHPIADAISVQVVADYACNLRLRSLDVFTHLQALQDDFIRAGRDILFFRHPLVSAARKVKTRYEGRVQGRKRLQNQKDLLTGEIVRKGI